MLFVLVLIAAPALLAAQPSTGDENTSRTRLEEATRREPRNARAWLMLAQSYARQKHTVLALAAARKAETLGSEDAAVLHGLAFLFTDLLPDPKRAAPLEERYAVLTPADRDAWRRVAAMYLDAGQSERAVAAGLRGLAAGDASAALHTTLGQAYLAMHQLESAAAQFAEAVRLDPYSEETHFQLAQAYLLRQDFPRAIDVLMNARKTFDKSPQIELALGVCYYGQRQFALAVDQFLKTMRLDPDVPQPYLFLGRILDQAGDRLGEATGRYAEFHRRHPQDALGAIYYAKALMAAFPTSGVPPEWAQADALLEQAIASKPEAAEAHYLLGCLLERKLESARAAAELERSVRLNPRDPAPHFHLARVYRELGRKEDAARERELHQKLSEELEAPATAPGAATDGRR
jgi:tetratricopeptide (TPR) repeat protein